MKRLTRSSSNKMISGVCGGIAEFFNIDPTLVRILYLLLAFNSSTSFIVIYIICTIIIPEDDGVIYQEDNGVNFKNNSTLFLGIGLIILGGISLTKMFLTSYDIRILYNINRILGQITRYFWPILLIVLGILILSKQKNNK